MSPRMAHHACAFKVTRDAILLRQGIGGQRDSGDATTDPELRRWHLRFIIVGAGFSGVEVAGEINELVRSSPRFYRNFRKEDVVVTLFHSQDHILPEVAPTLGEFARTKKRKADNSVRLNTRAVT